ncbi:MAG: response regulator transcription factor [Anaerolineales bacterium]|nr:response regulator transcription factor [Anaerolineales bacterium]
MVRIVIADDADLSLVGAALLLKAEPDFEVVGVCHDLADLLLLLSSQPVDVVVVSDRLDPDLNSPALVDHLRQAAPQARLILMSAICEGRIVHELLTGGAMGYLYKGDLLQNDLVNAVYAVMRGKPYLSPLANTEYLVAAQAGRNEWRLDDEARDVLRLLAQGYRPQEIGLQRQVSARRIYWVVSKLRLHFAAETNEHLIALAVQAGFLARVYGA